MRKKYKRTHNKKLKTYRKEKKSHSHRRKIKSRRSKLKTRRRKFKKYNKSLKKTFKGGVTLGVGEGVVAALGTAAAAAAVGTAYAGVKKLRGKKNDDVVNLDVLPRDSLNEVEKANKRRGKNGTEKKLELTYSEPVGEPGGVPGGVPDGEPGGVPGGEPGGVPDGGPDDTYIEPDGKPYKELLIDDFKNNIWEKYCPHYTADHPNNKSGKYTVLSMRWEDVERRHLPGWSYGVSYEVGDGSIDDGFQTNLPNKIMDQVGFNPDYEKLQELLDEMTNRTLISRVKRELLTKGSIVKDYDAGAPPKHLECLGIIWSPIEETWRAIYDNIKDTHVPTNWRSYKVYNIRLDAMVDKLYFWKYFGMNESLAKQKLFEVVGYSVNVRDYLFNSENNSFIKIRSIRWVTEAQKWDIVYYDYQKNEPVDEPWSSDFLDDYTKLGPPKYRLGNNGKKYGTVKYLKYLKKQKLFNLEIKKIIYNGSDKQYNYTIQEEYNLNPANSVRNTQIVVGSEQTLTEPDLDEFIKNNYTIGAIGA